MAPIHPKKQVSRTSQEASMKSRMSRIDIGNDTSGFGISGKTLLKPDDQLQLTETELNEEVAKVLTLQNPRVLNDLIEWSYKLREYLQTPDPPNTITILNVLGTLLHKNSEEAIRQRTCDLTDRLNEENEEHREDELMEEDECRDKKKIQEKAGNEAGPFSEVDERFEDENERERGEDARDEADDEEEDEKTKPKKIPNQFNFCERAALTYSNPTRDLTTQTVPPPTALLTDAVFQWTIYDEYQDDWISQQREKEKEKEKKLTLTVSAKKEKKKGADDSVMMSRMLRSIKTLERMVNQNIFDDVALDYRYWDDPSDEFKDDDGSLLPLWKFSYEKTKKHDVTDLCFNSKYYDLFAVSFGSMSFDNAMPSGAVGLFSLKNSSFPEWISIVESPVMSLDFNKDYPHLLVTGSMDGSVAVYNVFLPPLAPQYKSYDIKQKHTGIVWQVCWSTETEEGHLAFYSVSIDGKVNHWVLNQNELTVTTIMTLYLDMPSIPGPDGTVLSLKGCGTCIQFYPKDPHIYLVGTEEGSIYKCNTDYSTVYMRSYLEAHDMPVNRVVFNKFNSHIFASCSGDWRIKIWEDERPDPLFMFDIGQPIGDVQWAPFSSTVIACVSNDGKIMVFDLNINKYRPICSQQIVNRKRCKLTRLAFNHTLPFIVVGDDKGTINALKLSPNLRIKAKPTKKQLNLSPLEIEVAKLEKLLSFVREPDVLTSSIEAE